MGRIPQEIIDEIVRRHDIVGVIGRYTQLKKRGREWLGLCPFHGEKTPSFYVNQEKGSYFCHGCKEGGHLIHFVSKIEVRGFVETVVKLGEEVGIQVQLDEKDDPEEIRRRQLFELLERCSIYYHEMLLRSPLAAEARDYLDQRGVSAETVKRFRLGYAPPSGQALRQQLERSGFRVEDGLTVGVLMERGRVVDTLRARVTFPICDIQDRVVAFGGRCLDGSHPKYLNTPETELYSKRNQLFALSLHRQAISKQDQAVVAEGYLDVIMLDQVGVQTAVASLGTSLTDEQSRLLRRFTRNVVLAYDSDKAGQNATVRAIELFEQSGLRVHVAPLPPGEDPDSLARKEGLEGVQRALNAAVGVVDFHMNHCERKYNLATPEGKEDYSRAVMPAIEKIQDAVRKGAYTVRLANKLGITESQVQWKLSGRSMGARSADRLRAKEDEHHSEVKLFRICVHYPELLDHTRGLLSLDSLTHERMKPLFGALLAGSKEGQPVNLQDLLPHLEEPSARNELAELLTHEPPASSLEDVQKLLKSINDSGHRLRWEALRKEIVEATAAGTIEAHDERFQEYRRLQKLVKGAQ